MPQVMIPPRPPPVPQGGQGSSGDFVGNLLKMLFSMTGTQGQQGEGEIDWGKLAVSMGMHMLLPGSGFAAGSFM